MAVHVGVVLAAGSPATPAWGLLRRLRVRLRAPLLDARLAAGAVALSDTDLCCRSKQLVSTRTRRSVARAVERLWEGPRERRGLSAAIPYDRHAVRLARTVLAELVHALRSRDRVDPRGVALIRVFLTDPCSALYRPAYPEELYEIARAALFALRGTAVPQPSDEAAPVVGSASRRHGRAIAHDSVDPRLVSRTRRTYSRPDRAVRARGDF